MSRKPVPSMKEYIENDFIIFKNEQKEIINQLKSKMGQLEFANKKLKEKLGKFKKDTKVDLEFLKSHSGPSSSTPTTHSTVKDHDSTKIELDALKTITIPKQQQMIDSLKTEINKLKSNAVPIGFIYVQLSGQTEPNLLWPNTEWLNITGTYSGLFFRAEGGESSSFGKIQDDQDRSLYIFPGSCDPGSGAGLMEFSWFKIEGYSNEKFFYTGSSDSCNFKGIKIKHGNEEIRPRNQAIRIWQRTR